MDCLTRPISGTQWSVEQQCGETLGKCWCAAVKIYNDAHKDRHEKRIALSADEPGLFINISNPHAVQQQLQELLSTYENDNRPGKLSQISRELRPFCKVFDVFCEGQPYQVGVVWGFFRFFIQAAAQHADLLDTICESIKAALQCIGSGQEAILCITTEEEPHPRLFDVEKRVSNLFACTIYFLQKARKILEKSRRRQKAKAIFKNFDLQFASNLQILKRESRELKVFMQHLICQDIQTFRSKSFQWYSRFDTGLSKMQIILEDMGSASFLENYPAVSGQGIDEPASTTCEWVIHEDTYKKWQANGTHILVLHGGLGTGKSVIIKYLATRCEEENFAFFYALVPNKEDRSPVTFLRNLLSSVSCKNSELVKRLATGPSTPHDWKRRLERAWSIILGALQNKPRFTIFIDGLDECQFGDDFSFSYFMSQIIRLCTCPSTRVLMSSRHNSLFRDHNLEILQIPVDHNKTHDDIVTYTDNFIQTYPSLERCRSNMMAELSRRHHITFLEARLLWTSVREARTRNARQRRIREFPEKLTEIYNKIIANQRLASEERQDRRNIYLLLHGARRPLTLNHIRTAIALKEDSRHLDEGDCFEDPEAAILTVCAPFVSVCGSYVNFIHSSFKEFLHTYRSSEGSDEQLQMSDEDSDDYFVRKCFAVLLLDKYRCPSRIGILLRENVYPELRELEPNPYEDSDDFYEYAAHNWYKHLISLLDPASDIIMMANDLLATYSFVTWAEYLVKTDGDFRIPFQVNAKLQQWREQLPSRSKELFHIDKYFVGPYTALSEQYSAEQRDKILQWLCLYELVTFYSLATDYEKARPILESLEHGLTDLLGKENPLTLRAAMKGALLYFNETKMREARDVFQEIAEIQRRVLPEKSPDAFRSLQFAALSSYYMTEYKLSEERQGAAYLGLAEILGERSYDALCSSLYIGYAITGLARDEQALESFDKIYKDYSDTKGRDNGLSLMSLVAKGQSQRILGRLKEAHQSYEQAWETRVPLWGYQAFSVIDTAIHLLIVYRDMGTPEKAWEVLDQLEEEAATRKFFPQYCQITHMRGLLLYDRGDVVKARTLLQTLLDETPRYKDNRWLLWVRLSLATILRQQKHEDAASILFSKLIREKEPSVDTLTLREPDSPKLLKIAEEGLRLIRQRKDDEAMSLLRGENCEWVREEDFWIPVGGPAADTGLMREP